MRTRLRLMAVTAGLCLVAGFAGSASATVSVGVADSGVAANLGGQVLPGWNFLANSADTTDPVWHGTFVAGLVQAEAGADAAIVPMRICNLVNVSSSVPPVTCSQAALTSAIGFAVQNGIRIINVSNNFTTAGKAAFKTAIKNNPGLLIVAAAGNGTTNIDSKPQYPCSFHLPNILCVTATGPKDVLWKKANYGQTVQLAAPGVNIVGQTPWTSQPFPADLSQGTNCQVAFKLQGSASPLTITGTSGTTTATIATWSGSSSSLKAAAWPFPSTLQGLSNVSVSFTGGSSLTIQNPHAQCQGPTTQPFTSSGGSFSSATVTGAAAVLEDEFPTATTAQVVTALLNGATTDVTPAGKINGNRELNLNGAILQLQGLTSAQRQ